MNMKTQNNHQSMKTITETFLIEETINLLHSNEDLTKWSDLVTRLGLEGQSNLSKPEKSPIPFLHLKTSYKNICETLCPVKVNVNKYNKTPIPLEILDLVALSINEGYFEEIQVWYDDKSPDPFVIGLNYQYYSTDNTTWKNRHTSKNSAQKEMDENGWTGKPAKTFDYETYLIGKWADVKRTWEELKQMAIIRFQETSKITYLEQIKKAQRELEDLELNAIKRFS